jgi:alkylhydroperoxidase family enzyme
VRDWRAHPGFGAPERAVLAATDETLERGAISPETWRACESALGSAENLLELVTAIGNWRLFSQLLRSLEIPLEDGVASWPPDGRSPAVKRG